VKFYCIGDKDTVRGFRLAGIEAEEAATGDEARGAIQRAAAQPDCGIIIISEQVAAWVRQEVDGIRLTRDFPLVVEIPGPEGPLAERKGISDLVREAVGVSVE